MTTPFIVMCAPNGARKTKQDHPALPITPDELADCAKSIRDAGASMMHVHVRDDEGGHSLDTDRYRAAIAEIRAGVGDDLVIQVTTEACGIYEPPSQMAMVRELKPEAVSVALREFCRDEESIPVAGEFYEWLQRERIMAQHILYSPEEVSRFEALRVRGVIPDEKPFILYVLGRYSENLTGDVDELNSYIAATATDTTWAVCCFGSTEHDAVVKAAEAGGHARVGFENNLGLPDGRIAKDNAELVNLAASAGGAAARPLANADDVRERFL